MMVNKCGLVLNQPAFVEEFVLLASMPQASCKQVHIIVNNVTNKTEHDLYLSIPEASQPGCLPCRRCAAFRIHSVVLYQYPSTYESMTTHL